MQSRFGKVPPGRALWLSCTLTLAFGSSTRAEDQVAAPAPVEVRATPAESAQSALREAYRLKAAADRNGAEAAFEQARELGADAQVVALELGYLAAVSGRTADARRNFLQATQGNSADVAEEAKRQEAALQKDAPVQEPTAYAVGPAAAALPVGADHLALAYRLKSAHDPGRARDAFLAAAKAGASAQLVALELGYLDLASNNKALAKAEFERAAAGDDVALAKQARSELAAMAASGGDGPKRLWADLYADAFGWKRVVGAAKELDLVPTLRLRAYYTPFSSLDLHLFITAQVTRDTASRDIGALSSPLIYSDNKAIAGAGLLFRVWSRRVGLFAQIGPALELVDSSRKQLTLDARVGAYLGLESASCAVAKDAGTEWHVNLCHDLYASVTYINRFQHDVIGFARGRSGLSIALTGPLQWLLMGEARVAKDTNNEFYNNFVEAGIGPMLRLVRPFRFDLMFAPHAGTYFGMHHLDPAPKPLHYVDLRLQAATYVEF